MSRQCPFCWFSILSVIVLLLCPPSRAKVIYVSKNAAGAVHDGTSWSTAFLTVQEGVNAAWSADEVWVSVSSPGAPAYFESITMRYGVWLYGGFAGTETLRNQRNWKTNVTVLAGNQAGAVVTVPANLAQAAVIDGFTIGNSQATLGDAGISALSPVTISNNVITGNVGHGVYAGPATTISFNIISGNGGDGVFASGQDGLKSVTIASNTICGNNGDGVHIGFGTAILRGDTISGNGGHGVHVYASGQGDVANTLLVYNRHNGLRNDAFSLAGFAYNDVYGNSDGEYSGFTPYAHSGNISVDPKLSSAYYNVHLQPGSPCIDAGFNAYALGSVDIDGQPRISGATVDIGSDESDGTIWPEFGPTRFVSPTGSDAADGLTWATAKKTISDALSVAQAGSEVWVATGVYVGNVIVPFGVALYGGFNGTENERNERSVSANTTVIDGGGASGDVVTLRSRYVEVNGFTVRNGGNGIAMYGGAYVLANNTISGNSKDGVFMSGGTAALSKNAITGNSEDGVYVLGVATLTDNVLSRNGTGVNVDDRSTIALTGNTISENITIGVHLGELGTATVVGNAISGNGGAGVETGSDGTATLTGNHVSDNDGEGVRVNGGVAVLSNNTITRNAQGGVASYGTLTLTNNTIAANGLDGIKSDSGADLTNNTIVGNAGAGINTSGVATLTNNIVCSNGGYGVRNTWTVAAFSHNNVYGNGTGAYYQFTPTPGQGNITLDPKLSSIYHDIHLQPGSPCIDAGDDSAVTPGQTDVYGKPRVIGAHVDIGADESDGTAWTVPSRTWFVSPVGSDAADGLSWGTAKKTVTGALTASQGGDEVWVAKGTYVENVRIPAGVGLYGGFNGTEADRSGRSASGNPTVLDGSGEYIEVVASYFLNTVVDSFTIRGGRFGVNIYGGTAKLTNCVLFRNGGDGIHVDGGAAVVTNCTITGNSGNGVNVFGGNATLTNDTITANGQDGVIAYGTTNISNTVIAFNGGIGLSKSSSDPLPVFSHNDVFGNTKVQYQGYTPTPGQGNISVDPKLSSIYHDIHLQPGSPCIDAGDDSVVTPGQTDLFGKPRVIGSHVDIGADESDGTAWTIPSRTWFVSPSGSDFADGMTWATARQTVTAGLYTSEGGDEVWVAEGTYVEGVTIPAGVGLYGGFSGSETDRSERSAAANPTALDGGGVVFNVISLSSVSAIADGFTVRNGWHGISVSSGSSTVSNSVITGHRLEGVTMTAGTLALTNNVICSNKGRGISVPQYCTASLTNNAVYGNTGTGVDTAGKSTLTRNSIHDNTGYGVYAGGTATLNANDIYSNGRGVYTYGTATLTDNVISRNGGCGIQQPSGGKATLTNNTVSDNLSDGISANGSLIRVSNNIVAFNGGYGIAYRGIWSTQVYFRNDVYGNIGGQLYGITPPANAGNISVDPLFTDRTASDYHLPAGSPCIDAGEDSVLVSGATDIEGNPRKLGGHVDIGAYELLVPGFFALTDAVDALRAAAGLKSLDGPGYARLNVATEAGSASTVDVSDAALLLRKVIGPDPNP